jgi:hypothetical protein
LFMARDASAALRRNPRLLGLGSRSRNRRH